MGFGISSRPAPKHPRATHRTLSSQCVHVLWSSRPVCRGDRASEARGSPLQRAPARNQVIRHREVDVSSPDGPGFNFLGADLNESAFQKSRSSGTLHPAALCGRWSRTFHLRLNAPQTTSYSLYRPRRRAPARVTHALALLRARRERERSCAGEQRDELAPPCMSGKEHCEG